MRHPLVERKLCRSSSRTSLALRASWSWMRGHTCAPKRTPAELAEPKISEHHGRIIKNTGDGVLLEFASVVDAVRCAVEIQREMIDRNVDFPEDRRIVFRFGINLGDVIVEPDHIHGDGVNVAARLEGWRTRWCVHLRDSSRSGA